MPIIPPDISAFLLSIVPPIDVIGSVISILGTIVSLYGVYLFNIRHNHDRANEVWCFSNLFLMCWAWGYRSGWWTDGLSADALFTMYLVFTVASIYRLVKKNREKMRLFIHGYIYYLSRSIVRYIQRGNQ
jgi:hypothetical protein